MRSKIVIHVSLLLLVFAGCQSRTEVNYVNKPEYTIAIGEEVRIYYSVNSCCECCVLNLDNLKHVSLLDDILVENYPDDCAGCNATYAFVFAAQNLGTDTIYLNVREASASCYEVNGEPEMFIIHVQ